MDTRQAAEFVKIALAGMDREYPNKPSHVFNGLEDLKTPSQLHPVFYGHFDWHSSVHGHWMLLRLLKEFPEAEFAAEIRSTMNRRLTQDGLLAEAAYFRIDSNKSFERMYGWAWALKLAQELRSFDDSDCKKWAANFAPLEKEIVGLAKGYLPKLDWPVRCGFHPESAFPLGFMLDYARATGDEDFEVLLVEKSRKFYLGDRDYPTAYEPSGNDFFSPGLNVADLMRRVLPANEYSEWLTAYFPHLAEGKAGNLLTPVVVSDPTDGHLVHLAGLNLSRVWTMRGIASVLSDSDPRKEILLNAAEAHLAAGMNYVGGGHYEGDHWLATFAVRAMTMQ
ncbi:DUF2891 domain-containing protein [Luteolibacter pohnpeiensis]|nr:DUF2891 domain-containing protein [Luteolibacter pohnpeiensis]